MNWYPCEYPEKPNDGLIVWHETECIGCHVAAVATLRRHPDDPIVARIIPGIVTRTQPRSDDDECWL